MFRIQQGQLFDCSPHFFPPSSITLTSDSLLGDGQPERDGESQDPLSSRDERATEKPDQLYVLHGQTVRV